MNRSTVKTKAIATVTAAALMLGLASAVSAQPRDDRGRGGPDRGDQMDHGRPGPGPGAYRGRGPAPRPNYDRGPGGGPEHQWHRGDRLPSDWRSRQYVVDDWRSHRLQPPPRGYNWVQVGADFALVAITTGIIAQLIMNQ